MSVASASGSSHGSPSGPSPSSGTVVSSPAAFQAPAVAPLVRDVGLEAGEQVGAEAAARGLVAREPALLERGREEALREVLGFLLARAPAPAQMAVDGPPVGGRQASSARARSCASPLLTASTTDRRVSGNANGGWPQRFAKSSVACTSSLRIPGSFMLWPASFTITSFDFGQRLCSAQALAAGHTTS